MIPFLISGLILGFSAGVAPGPLLALVIGETIQHGLKAGIKVAFAPVVTDFPIVILSLMILSRLSYFHGILAVISIFGACFIICLGVHSIRTTGAAFTLTVKEQSLQKGIIANFLSPHPYLFWMSVGAPITVKAMNQSVLAAAGFVGIFYLFLVGSKIAIAMIISRSRSFLTGRAYTCTMRCVGVILIILAGILFYDGVKLLMRL